MTTKTFDSTVSRTLQDDSSIEYVAPEKNPLATTPKGDVASVNALFDFHAEHNGEACIESFDPKDRGTERQFRFTRALLCTILGVKSEDTIASHVDKLLKRGVVTETRNLVSVMLPDSLGRECIKTTLYDLTVFNYLVMRLDTDQAWEKKAKFNDVLIERETGVTKSQTPVPSYMLESEEERAIAWAEEHRQARLALEAKEREIKSLQAQKDVLMQDYMSLKGFCNGLIAKGLAVQTNGKPYVIGTLRTKLSPILQTVSAKFRYSISEETVVVDGVERKTPYYHKDVCKMVENVITPQWLRCPDVSIITDEI